jgi:hypothetical protein
MEPLSLKANDSTGQTRSRWYSGWLSSQLLCNQLDYEDQSDQGLIQSLRVTNQYRVYQLRLCQAFFIRSQEVEVDITRL